MRFRINADNRDSPQQVGRHTGAMTRMPRVHTLVISRLVQGFQT